MLCNKTGVRLHPLFCLQKSYWQRHTKKHIIPIENIPTRKIVVEPPDVASLAAAAAATTTTTTTTTTTNESAAIRVLHLHKHFPNANSGRGLTAVNDLSLYINFGECFGFLGPNGAG